VKRSFVLALAISLTLALAGGLGQVASAGVSKRAGAPTARGRIGSAAPSRDAAARIRALGRDDGGEGGSGDGGEVGSDDDGGGLVAGGHAAHGTIGHTRPKAGAAARIRALGLDD
jgi:hypothetical protein